MELEKIGIIGVGAIGTVLAAKLSNAGHDVYVVDNQKEIEERYIGVTLLHFEESYETSILSNIITIRDCIMKISHHAADIAELTIDRSYRSDDRV